VSLEFRIADTFTDSLARLTGDEQKAVKTTAFDLQMDPSHPGLKFHKLDRAKDKRFWSVRANDDVRVIVHRSDTSLLLCYVDHHDRAYAWAERRKLETHPTTGAAQLVELVETVREIEIPRYVERKHLSAPLFAQISDEQLLGYGVPPEWLERVRAATEDSLLEIAGHLPAEAGEALLDLATGRTPVTVRWTGPGTDPFEHPDAQRRFRTLKDADELAAALEYPWDKWTVFLHPAQRDTVERAFAGPARVSGTAGTGKTIVALHRAVFLANADQDARVLLTTFSDALANALKVKLRRLLAGRPRLAERIDVESLDSLALRLYAGTIGRPTVATPADVHAAVMEALKGSDIRFSAAFVESEFVDVVDAWQLDTWEGYREIARLGRKTRLPETQRAALWEIFQRVQAQLASRGLATPATMLGQLTAHYLQTGTSPYDHVVVDEAQDISVAQLRFVAALAGDKPNGLFFAGDLGQRIFRQPFSWKSLGVNVIGRSRTLRVNYRTSHQIRRQADLLLAPELSDLDGYTEERRGAVSVFNGPEPTITVFASEEDEAATVAEWLRARAAEGVGADEIAVFVRSPAQLTRAQNAVERAGLAGHVFDEKVELQAGHVAISTMHIAKGLEFRAVVVMACDDGVIPSDERIAGVTDDADLEDVYNTERQLLYVACTRARDHLMVGGVDPASEFLDDLAGPDQRF